MLAPASILLVPLLAMQFTDEMAWGVFDFAVAGVLLVGIGLVYALVRKAGKLAYRAAVGIALAAALILVWMVGAVGIIGETGDPADLMYLGVLAVGIIGAIIARFRPEGMARALLAMALVQALVAAIALIAGKHEGADQLRLRDPRAERDSSSRSSSARPGSSGTLRASNLATRVQRLMALQTRGSDIVDGHGDAIRLKGVNIGGWLNMENFITGYAANETMMRAAMRKVLGDDGYELFFERLLSAFYADADAAFLAETGLNCVRIPVNYRHLESDARPFEIIEDGFRHLDRAIAAGGEHGVYTLIDLHALPGSQNQHWHSDNPTHRALFWEHRHFQDRVVGIWEAIADRYKGNPWVAGYNLMNEPADESRAVVGPFYERLSAAIREIDPEHILFFDGNTYSTEFGFFGEPLENAVYTLHDYVPAGLGRADEYPGPESAEAKFLERSEYARRTGTPIYVGEFAPIYTGDEAVDAERRRILDDQLQLYRRYGAGLRHVDVQGPRPPGADLRPARLALRRAGRRLRGQEAAARGRPVGEQRTREPGGHPADPGPRRARGAGLRSLPVGALRLRADAGAQHHARPAAGRRVRRALPRPRRGRADRARGLVRVRALRRARDACATSCAPPELSRTGVGAVSIRHC